MAFDQFIGIVGSVATVVSVILYLLARGGTISRTGAWISGGLICVLSVFALLLVRYQGSQQPDLATLVRNLDRKIDRFAESRADRRELEALKSSVAALRGMADKTADGRIRQGVANIEQRVDILYSASPSIRNIVVPACTSNEDCQSFLGSTGLCMYPRTSKAFCTVPTPARQ